MRQKSCSRGLLKASVAWMLEMKLHRPVQSAGRLLARGMRFVKRQTPFLAMCMLRDGVDVMRYAEVMVNSRA